MYVYLASVRMKTHQHDNKQEQNCASKHAATSAGGQEQEHDEIFAEPESKLTQHLKLLDPFARLEL